MKAFLATVSQTNGRGPRCTEADQAGIEAPVLSLELEDPLEEEDAVWDTAMVEAVSTVMNTFIYLFLFYTALAKERLWVRVS